LFPDGFIVVSAKKFRRGKELLFQFERMISDGIKDTISLKAACNGTVFEVRYSYSLFEDNHILAVAELRFCDLDDPSVCTFIETAHFRIEPASLPPSI